MWFILFAVGVGVFGVGTGIGYNLGSTANNHAWLLKENQWMAAVEKIKEEKEKEIKAEKDKNDEILIRVINDAQKAEQERNDAIHKLVTSGLYVSTEEGVCGDSLPREAESTSKPSDAKLTARKVRIHGKSERDIQEMINDAQEIADKYKALYKVCAPHIDIISTDESN